MEFAKYSLSKPWYSSSGYTVLNENTGEAYKVKRKAFFSSAHMIFRNDEVVSEIISDSFWGNNYKLIMRSIDIGNLKAKFSLKPKFELILFSGSQITITSTNWGKKYLFIQNDQEVAMISIRGAFKNQVGIAISERIDPLIILSTWIAMKIILMNKSSS